MGYDQEFKLKSIECYKTADSSIGKIAFKEGIPKQTLARWIRSYRNLGKRGLENKRAGVKEKPINVVTEIQVLQLWKEKKRSRYRMRRDLKLEGIDISEWQIQKIYKKHNLIY